MELGRGLLSSCIVTPHTQLSVVAPVAVAAAVGLEWGEDTPPLKLRCEQWGLHGMAIRVIESHF